MCIRDSSATGRRFQIEQATVWNLIDEQDAIHGQAATFDRWTDLPDGGRQILVS